MNAKKYFLPLLSILLLASCNGKTDSPTEKPNDSLSNVLPSPSISGKEGKNGLQQSH